ncbi:DEKNAAC103079 [Brettanomyces naardenensis]|uniref:DEKNAAC103079 n=1 Tax=Brettanomyces naardenensis TaxID=13370 RepID=A0A448YMG1_BRENA|nr:DEKNAAC103079 [Brettanomyces naardenensis]
MGMGKSTSFEGRTFMVPKTPERTPGQLQSEGTPLLSPSFLSTTPKKRRSTDFYSLLKSPMLNNLQESPASVKRRSIELNKAIEDRNFVFHDSTGSPLLKSPNRSPVPTSYSRVARKTEPEIKKISDNLRTRLNYAKAKIQHGWSDKSITEVRKKLQEEKSSRLLTDEDKNRYDQFWRMQDDKLPEALESSSAPGGSTTELPETQGTPRSIGHRRNKSASSRISLDDIASRQKRGSADRALLQALSPEVKVARGAFSSPRTSRVSGPQPPPPAPGALAPLKTSPSPENRLEQDAIMSLMSLSSPVKYSASGSTSPTGSHADISPKNGPSNKLLPPTTLPPISPSLQRNSSSQSTYLPPPPPLAPPKFNTIDDDTTEDETEDEHEQDRGLPGNPSISRRLPAPRTLGPPIGTIGTSGLSGLGLSSSMTGEQLQIKPLRQSRSSSPSKQPSPLRRQDEDEERTASEASE